MSAPAFFFYAFGAAAVLSALAMVLNAAGVTVTPEDLVEQVYLPGRKGSLQVEMLAAARRRGLVAYELARRVQEADKQFS